MNTIITAPLTASRKLFFSDQAILIYLALAKFLLHFITNLSGGYGYFRDELYYIACSDHLAWGYVDQPPFSIGVLWLNRALLGDSLAGLRFLPALTGALTVIFTGFIVKELGGNRFAQVLAASCVIAAPMMVGFNTIYSMNAFDILIWSMAFYLVILIVKYDRRKYWILLGIVLGIGLLNKISILWLGTGLAVGLLVTPLRKRLFTVDPWFTAGIAFLLFLPHILWQVNHDFPTLEFMKNATANKYVSVSPLELFLQQALLMQPITFPIWLAGLVYFLGFKIVRPFRILPIIYFTVFLILAINRNSKAEYLGSTFPMLFALGAVSVEKFIINLRWNWPKPAIVVLILAGGIALLPLGTPVLPVEKFISYMNALGMKPSTTEKKELSRLPQYYADMFGWEKMTVSVAETYNKLTPDEQSRCAIYCNNYGEAGAIDFFGKKYNLPNAISGHNNYWIWGPHAATGEFVIRLGGSEEELKKYYAEVIKSGVFEDEYCMPYENHMPVWICKKRQVPFDQDWIRLKHFQ